MGMVDSSGGRESLGRQGRELEEERLDKQVGDENHGCRGRGGFHLS